MLIINVCQKPTFRYEAVSRRYTEAYLEPSRTTTMELFCENS